MRAVLLSVFLLLAGCVGAIDVPADFIFAPIDAGGYKIATFQRISDNRAPLRIYIEGDGYAFDGRGQPTANPTPRSRFLRDLAASDSAPNVIYMARPCQYIKSDKCRQSDWTDGRFSERVVNAMSDAVVSVARGRPVELVGYSGGAMISGLVIERNPTLNVQQWITIAGVLNHRNWTEYFGDMPLKDSLDLDALPDVKQRHFVAYGDKVVPNVLSRRWVAPADLVVVPNATHTMFPLMALDY